MLIMAMLFAACGDDDSSFAPRDNTVSDSDIVAESFDDLPVCSSKREGATAYIKDEKNAYMCVDGDWTLNDDATSSSSVTADETKQSSSSEALQSSSSEVRAISSSSENISAGSIYDATAKTLKDLRDDKTYKTVTIGTQTWMAENLNYAYTGVPYNYNGHTSDSTSWCYNNDPDNCAKYGRLYTWAAAMDSVGTWTTNGKGCGHDSTCSPTGTIRGICPEGWHLPDTTEWNTLFTSVGGKSTAGTKLKSTGGWFNDGNGTDAFGFSALPAGNRYDSGGYNYEGSNAYFWSSTEDNSDYAYRMYLYYNYDYALLYDYNKINGHSVRCLKD